MAELIFVCSEDLPHLCRGVPRYQVPPGLPARWREGGEDCGLQSGRLWEDVEEQPGGEDPLQRGSSQAEGEMQYLLWLVQEFKRPHHSDSQKPEQIFL